LEKLREAMVLGNREWRWAGMGGFGWDIRVWGTKVKVRKGAE
jgi:hypothetical protein